MRKKKQKGRARTGVWLGWLLIGVLIVIALVALSFYLLQPEKLPLFVAIVSTLFSALSALSAWFMIRETQIDRAERSRPWVIVDFPFTSKSMIYCRVQNMGPGIARNISLSFDPVPIDFKGAELTDLPMFQNPIPILSPGAEIRQFFHGPDLYGKQIPLQFTVTVDYEGESGFRDEGIYCIDLQQYKGSTLPPKTAEDQLGVIEEQMKRLVRRVEHITNLTSLIVETPDQLGERISRQTQDENRDR